MKDKKTKTSLPFIRAYNFLLEREDLKPTEKLVLIVLCKYWPSPFWGTNSSIADVVNISRRQVVNIINNLKTKGLIKAGYAHRNRDGQNHTVRLIVPLCLEGKCRLAGETDFTSAGEKSGTDMVKNTVRTSEMDCTLLERNRKKNRKATSSPLPSEGQAKPLVENAAQPTASPIVRNFAQVLKGTSNSFNALSEKDCQRRRLEQIQRLKAWA